MVDREPKRVLKRKIIVLAFYASIGLSIAYSVIENLIASSHSQDNIGLSKPSTQIPEPTYTPRGTIIPAVEIHPKGDQYKDWYDAILASSLPQDIKDSYPTPMPTNTPRSYILNPVTATPVSLPTSIGSQNKIAGFTYSTAVPEKP